MIDNTEALELYDLDICSLFNLKGDNLKTGINKFGLLRRNMGAFGDQ